MEPELEVGAQREEVGSLVYTFIFWVLWLVFCFVLFFILFYVYVCLVYMQQQPQRLRGRH